MCTKWTVTEHWRTSLCLSDLCINTDTFFDRIFVDLYPNTKSKESITLLFPLPLAPTILVKLCNTNKKLKILISTYNKTIMLILKINLI